jgi:hypothetical protein
VDGGPVDGGAVDGGAVDGGAVTAGGRPAAVDGGAVRRGGRPAAVRRPVRGDRLARLREIESLDPERDHWRIHRISSGWEFPWDYEQSLSLALFRTFAVPGISAILAGTREFAERGQKRYDDTRILMAELVEHGYDSPRGRLALRTVNRSHGRYPIDPDDMRYVLSTFVCEPVRWIDRYGWRRLSEHEVLAAYHFYREVGRRMGIRGIPASYTELVEFNVDYERDRFRYAPTNAEVGRDTIDVFAAWYPRPLRPLVRRAVLAALDEPLRTAFRFPRQPAPLRGLVRAGLRGHGLVERALPPRREAIFTTGAVLRTYPGYPHGYDLAAIGPHSPPPCAGSADAAD